MTKNLCDVGAVIDFPEDGMREVEAHGRKILVVHQRERWHAVGAECPHYGASLAEGVLCGDRLVCPWHKAVFRITDGTLLEPPALDALPCYSVRVDGERVFVELSTKAAAVSVESKADPRTFVIVGAGGAGTAAAERLRQLGFGGRIVMVSPEAEAPYDRTKLSKEFLSGNAGAEELPLRPPEFWTKQGIERQQGSVVGLDVQARTVTLSDRTQLHYNKLLLATGSVPRSLDVPGCELGGVFTLRSQSDAQRIAEAARPGARVVVMGNSFIALEAASCFALRKMPVTVVVSEAVPFAKQLGPEVGGILQQWHEQHGVEFRLRAQVHRFEGTGVVRKVVLKSGEELPCDAAVVGVGVRPPTEFAEGLKKEKDGGVVVDEHLRADGDVFAAGDIAVFPESYSGQQARIEHWRVAEQQGRCAAANMLGQDEEFAGVPYFWTNHFGTRFDYIGHADKWDEVILKPGAEFPAFLAHYVLGDQVVAAAACRQDAEIALMHERMRERRLPGA